MLGKLDSFIYEGIRHFVDCVADDRAPSATVEDGLINTVTIATALRSIEAGRPLPIRPEVRAQTRAKVAGATHVQHLVVAIAEEVDPGRGRCAEGQRSLCVHLAHAWRGQIDEIRDCACAPFLCKPDQLQQDLGGRLSVG